MTDFEMQEWKEESIRQALEQIYGELLASYAEMPFIGNDMPTFGEGWRK